mmetsp:Transcript_8275/g.24997  ORF Transcript_8275/g.24997 Transcript_8275/m.24997 type:complete len:354 (-) Transcript_8275:2901-3962(-)
MDAAAALLHPQPSCFAASRFDAADYTEQLEEALALQAIYEDAFRVAGASGLPPCSDLEPDALLADCPPPQPVLLTTECLVHVDVPPPGLQLCIAARARGGEGGSKGAGGAGPSTDNGTHAIGEPVLYLPPLRLRLRLPPGYPSTQPPLPSLHAVWLTEEQALELARTLLGRWDAGAAGPVTYEWVEYLRCGALDALGIDGRLELLDQHGAAAALQQQASEAAGEAAEALGGGNGAECLSSLPPPPLPPPPLQHVDVEQIAMNLLRYNASKCAEAFGMEMHCCPICFDDVVGSKCVLLDCSHAFCAECFSTHCRMHTLEGSVESVRCPDPACRVQVPPHVLSKVLTQVRASRET